MLDRPPRSAGWLGAPPGATWADDGDPNPFVRWRTMLWSYTAAQEAGWSDDRFVSLVRSLDDAVCDVAGTGFRVTPMLKQPALANVVGIDPDLLLVKDETGNVSGSHKARHLFGLLLHLAVDDVPVDQPLAISSCGNAALGAASVARAAGRPLDVFIPTWADPAVVDQLASLGARLNVCERRPGEVGDPCYLRFREAVAAGAYPFGCQGTENLLTIDGGRTLAWELAVAAPTAWRLFVQVGGGALGSSLVQGWCDALDHGVVDHLPVVFPVQAEGCAPLDRAVSAARSVAGSPEAALSAAIADPDRYMRPWDEPHSSATGILDDVTYDWIPLAWAVWATGGETIVAAEGEIARANRAALDHTSIPADSTGTAGLAGIQDGSLAPAPGPTIVLFTGRQRR